MVYIKNSALDRLLSEYNLPSNLNIHAAIPHEIQEILDDEIIKNTFWIGLRKMFIPTKNPEEFGQSYYEDTNNHFHVDWYVSSDNKNKDSLVLAIVVLQKLVLKFEKAGISWIRFWLNFETSEMAKKFAVDNGLDEDGDEYHTSDRLSFYTRRDGQEVISSNFEGTQSSAILIIDI